VWLKKQWTNVVLKAKLEKVGIFYSDFPILANFMLQVVTQKWQIISQFQVTSCNPKVANN
jgi:hypothetical protein